MNLHNDFLGLIFSMIISISYIFIAVKFLKLNPENLEKYILTKFNSLPIYRKKDLTGKRIRLFLKIGIWAFSLYLLMVVLGYFGWIQ